MNDVKDRLGLRGEVIARLYGSDGKLKQESRTHNLITSSGDAVLANNLVQVADSSLAGMNLGTGSTAAVKANTALETQITNSYKPNDDTFPKRITDGGSPAVDRRVSNQTSWGAGEATSAGIREVGLWTAGTAGGDPSGTMIGHSIFAVGDMINKGASDTLVITWNIDLTGA
jgi:hypothetical protein